METYNQTTNTSNTDLFPQQPKELPGMLNVLTILTFIGCGLSYIGAFWSFYQSSNYEAQMAELQDAQDQMGDSEMMSKMMEGSMEILQKTHEYRYILLLSGILFATLCLVGALQMRKLKKSGFPLYVIGELGPIVLNAVLIGFSLAGGIATLGSAIVALVFIILYATQRKHLVH